MKDVQGKDNARDKVLISMKVPETCLNPYYNYDEEDDKRLADGMLDESLPYAYASNFSSPYLDQHHRRLDQHLRRLTQQRQENPNFDQE